MWIDELADGEVFVFGSNSQGLHRGGAARTAHQQFGAVWGQGHGLQGRSYAIDSMSGLAVLREEVKSFYAFAGDNPDLTFLVTPIGTGVAGHPAEAVAPIFADPPRNVVLPGEFLNILARPSLEEQSSVREAVDASTVLHAPRGPSSEYVNLDLRHAFEDVKSQVRELKLMPAVVHQGAKRLSAQYYPRPAEEEYWRLDVPARTEAQVLRALADALEARERPDRHETWLSEHALLQYLSRTRYARGHWQFAGHPLEMGDYWWAVQLKHLINARGALAGDDASTAARALAAAARCPSNGGADYDYVLEALTELAFVERESSTDPAPQEWAALALTLAGGLPGWRPGPWFSGTVLQRLENIAHAARD